MGRPGDQDIIHDWKTTYNLDQLKQLAIEKGFTTLSVGPQSFAIMKRFDGHLTNELNKEPKEQSNKIYILHMKETI